MRPTPRTTSSAKTCAARVAVRLEAGELALLKSTSPPIGCDREGAARLGLVDPEFPRASKGVAVVSFVNLRECPVRQGKPCPTTFLRE